MQIDFKGSYSYLISHTFPGLLAGVEVVLFFKLFTPIDVFEILYNICKTGNLIVLLLLFVLSTVMGLIVDAIHHRLFRKSEEKLKSDELYKYIKNTDHLNIFTKIDNDYWYYYETCANIMLSLLPGVIFIPILLSRYGVSHLVILIFIAFYAYILWILYDEAKYTLEDILGVIENNFLENLKGENHPESQ